MSNPAAALGQEIGKLFEASILDRLEPVVQSFGHKIGPQRMKNGTDNVYQIDAVISNAQDQPVIILDPKYIRYTKHNRDKASWLCVAHYNLRKTYPTIRKSTAVLAGNWSNNSLNLIKSFGVEVITTGFQGMVDTLRKYHIKFDWEEQDRSTPLRSLAAFNILSGSERSNLAYDLTESVMPTLTQSVVEVLSTDRASLRSRVSSVEVLVKTDRHEMLLLPFSTVADTVSGLVKFMDERSDVSDLLEG